MNFTPKFAQTKDRFGHDIARAGFESVTHYMTPLRKLVYFNPSMDICYAMQLMMMNSISGGAVLDNSGYIVGILSEKDCLRVMVDISYHHQEKGTMTVADYMSTEVHTVHIDDDILDVTNRFLSSDFRRFPVIDDFGKLKGQVSRRDMLAAVVKLNPEDPVHV